MNMNDNGPGNPAKPPLGLVAEAALKTEKPATAVPTDKPVATFPDFDKDYVEPASLAALKKEFEDAVQAKSGPRLIEVGKQLYARSTALLDALLPFAAHAMSMANMRMCLTADGRPQEPTGGTWLNGVKSANLQSNENLFFRAADAVGRRAVEQHVMELFTKLQQAQAAQRERDKFVESATLAGPAGGPVTGQIH